MGHVIILGGGLSGCTAALELADRDQKVTIIEKGRSVGGKVREFGCKSDHSCNNCGVCLSGRLWDSVENHSRIEIMTETKCVDITGSKGEYSVFLNGQESRKIITEISSILVAIGFERSTSESFGNLELTGCDSIINGFTLEKIISGRNRQGFFSQSYPRIAFIQCFGSRDIQEKALYCSRVCCAYSTRAAKAIKHCYPDTQITFFYMDMQYVEEGQYFDSLTQKGFEFIKCRPVRLKSGQPAKLVFEAPETESVIEREFDLIVLSEGIHPPADAEQIADICTLGIDEKGFLKDIRNSRKTGIYLAGCASGPKRIEETYAESVAVARQLLADMGK